MNKQTFRIYQFNNNKLWWVNAIANLFLTVCLIVAVMLFVFSCVTSECIVVGASMVPTYNADDKAGNDIVFVNKYDDDYERGDVVVIELPNAEPIIKRVIGVQGDRIEIKEDGIYLNGSLLKEAYLNPDEVPNYKAWIGKSWTVGKDQVFVMGDNRNHSSDSRAEQVGLISEDAILGKVVKY